MYDINKVRSDFPILSRTVYDRPLVYLDNAATTQKPLCVLDAMREEYLNANANVHRGVHYLSQRATDLHEAARETVRRFINAPKVEEIIFTRGTTESINLVVSSFCEGFMTEGDEVIVSVMEHHSNIVPWQLQAAKRGIALKVIPMDDSGKLDMEAYERLFSDKTKIVSIAHVSNTLGTVNPSTTSYALPMSMECLYWWMEHSLLLTSLWMFRQWIATSSLSLAIRYMVLPALECYMARRNGSTVCHLIRVVAR